MTEEYGIKCDNSWAAGALDTAAEVLVFVDDGETAFPFLRK